MADAVVYDGRSAAQLEALLGVPRVELRDVVSSTLDVAHECAAAGAVPGTVVLSDQQRAGRGRQGRRWESAPGAGIWLTLIERPRDLSAVAVLSIRIGLHVAPVLDHYVAAPVQLKWPNDLYAGEGKLAGTLVETRWRNDRLDWVAIGFGLNVRPPEAVPHAASLVGVKDRGIVLAELVPALRSAAAATGPLTAEEIDDFAARDLARARACREPARGIVQGLDVQGALIVRTAAGDVACRTGSLVLEDDA